MGATCSAGTLSKSLETKAGSSSKSYTSTEIIESEPDKQAEASRGSEVLEPDVEVEDRSQKSEVEDKQEPVEAMPVNYVKSHHRRERSREVKGELPTVKEGVLFKKGSKEVCQAFHQPLCSASGELGSEAEGGEADKMRQQLEMGSDSFGDRERGKSGQWDFYDILADAASKRENYEDPDFPAELSSLCELGDEQGVKRFSALDWKRPVDFFKDPFSMFLGDIEPNDIHQGHLGDCYFLSVLASLAEWPVRIKKMFLSDEIQRNGCYGVRLCVRGEWQGVVVDDRFPCLPGPGGGPAFSRGNGSELWVMVLEKAWAKLYGSYQRIESGLTSHCLTSFTGAPTRVLSPNDEELWNLVLCGEKQNWIMSAGCTDDAKQASAVGLIQSHAYSLLSACELMTPKGTVRLVQLRNPWGHREWLGDWSDTSSLWTPELKSQIGGMHVSDDGTFFMSLLDYRAYFRSTTLCMYFDDFKTTSVQQKTESGATVAFSVEVQQASKCYFSVHQDCERFAPDPEAHRYSIVSILVGRSGEYCGGKSGSSRDAWVEVDAEPGIYYVWLRAYWEGGTTGRIGFSTYSADYTNFRKVATDESQDMMNEVFMDHGRKNAVLENYSGLGEANCFKGSVDTLEGSYIYYKNNSEALLTEDLEFTQLEGFELAPPYHGTSGQVVVPGGSEGIVLLMPTTKKGRSWGVQSWTSFKMPVSSLVNAAKSHGQAIHRQFEGKDANLVVYSHAHQTGAVYHFENATEDLMWMETWTFEFANLTIVDHDQNSVDVKLPPGESKTICFERDGRSEWKLGGSVSGFKVHRT